MSGQCGIKTKINRRKEDRTRVDTMILLRIKDIIQAFLKNQVTKTNYTGQYKGKQ